MNVKKQLRRVACLGLPVAGFALICLGVYLMSLRTEGRYDTVRVLAAYVQVVGGFLAMLIWVCWAGCHSMKSKLYVRGGHGQAGQPLQHIYTIDRPFPPSYEESQRSHVDPDSMQMVVVVVEEGPPTAGLAPPLYTEHISDVPDSAWDWDQPPPYTGPAPTS